MLTPREVLDRWLAAYNARDAYALAELYHEDAANHQVALGEPLHGREAILQSSITFFNAFPDNYTIEENVVEQGDWIVVEWSGGGTFLGPLGPNQPNGRSFKLRGCGFLQIRDGKIILQRGYFDRLSWFDQLGLPVE